MKQKNYDAEQMYKEYMQSVSADRTAIDDILSGERQPANVGARIKHSTGKMAAVTAAAAAIAIFAGVGLSNLNESDAPKSGTSTSSVSTIDSVNALRKSFRIETTQMTAAPFGARTTLTLIATDEKGKEIIKKYGSTDVAKNHIWLGGSEPRVRPEIVDSTGYRHEWHNDCKVTNVSEDRMTFICDTFLLKEASEPIPFTINVFIPDKSRQLTADQIANGEDGYSTVIASAKLTYKVDTAVKVFKSQDGEVFKLSDINFFTNHDDKNRMEALLLGMKFNLADGTQKSFTKQELSYLDMNGTETFCTSGGYIGDGYKLIKFFNDAIKSDEVTSVIYDGIMFKPESTVTADTIKAAKWKTEAVQMNASDHAMSVTVKLTALNDDARKILKEEGSDINITPPYPENFDIVATSSTTPVVTQDTYTSRLDFVCLRSKASSILEDGEKFSVSFTLASDVPNSEFPDDRRLNLTVKKNMTERVFKSDTGKTLWLSDYHFSSDHVPAANSEKKSYTYYEIKFADGTTKTPFNTQTLGSGSTLPNAEYPSSAFYFKDKIDINNVTSVTFDGIEFKPQ